MKKKLAGKSRSRAKPGVRKMRATPAAESPVICTTKFDAARELKARLGRGSVRMLSDWLKQGMPGCAAKAGKAGRFVIDEMVTWARENLDDLTPASDEASLLSLETKRQKGRQEQLKTEEMEREAAEKRGNILPRDEFTQFLRDAIVVARQQLVALPKQLAAMEPTSKLQRKFLDEATRHVKTICDGLEAAFALGPDSANAALA